MGMRDVRTRPIRDRDVIYHVIHAQCDRLARRNRSFDLAGQITAEPLRTQHQFTEIFMIISVRRSPQNDLRRCRY